MRHRLSAALAVAGMLAAFTWTQTGSHAGSVNDLGSRAVAPVSGSAAVDAQQASRPDVGAAAGGSASTRLVSSGEWAIETDRDDIVVANQSTTVSIDAVPASSADEKVTSGNGASDRAPATQLATTAG